MIHWDTFIREQLSSRLLLSITVPSGYCWSEHSIHNVDTRVLWSLISISCWHVILNTLHILVFCVRLSLGFVFSLTWPVWVWSWDLTDETVPSLLNIWHWHYILRVSHQCAGWQTAYDCWTRARDHVSYVWRHDTMQIPREFPARNDIWATRWSCRSHVLNGSTSHMWVSISLCMT